MSYCANCGSQIAEGGVCTRCEPTSQTHGLRLAPDEVLVKEYQATRLLSPKADGFLLVTNRRVIFVGEGAAWRGSSVIIREVHLPDVSGVSSYYGAGIHFGYLIAGILSALVILSFIGFMMKVPVLLVLLAVPVFLIWKALNTKGKTIAMAIYCRSQSESPIAFAAQKSRFAMLRSDAARAVIAEPGPDAELVIREIGALILDLQTRGTLAVELWTNAESAARPA